MVFIYLAIDLIRVYLPEIGNLMAMLSNIDHSEYPHHFIQIYCNNLTCSLTFNMEIV